MNRFEVGDKTRLTNEQAAELLKWFGRETPTTITFPDGTTFNLGGLIMREAHGTRQVDGGLVMDIVFEDVAGLPMSMQIELDGDNYQPPIE